MVASFGCSLFRDAGFMCQKPLSLKPGALSYSFAVLTIFSATKMRHPTTVKTFNFQGASSASTMRRRSACIVAGESKSCSSAATPHVDES